MTRLHNIIFRLYEKRSLRDWFYTIAFLIFVPVGLRFALLAWEFGSWLDKPLAVIAGLCIGITAFVTLLRYWSVPPRRVATGTPTPMVIASPPSAHIAEDFLIATRRRAAENRALSLSAGALGSTLRKRW